MKIGYCLVSTAPAKENDVYNEVNKIDEVTELHPLFGEYDLIAKIEAENYEKIGKIVLDKIRPIKGIKETKTLTGIEF